MKKAIAAAAVITLTAFSAYATNSGVIPQTGDVSANPTMDAATTAAGSPPVLPKNPYKSAPSAEHDVLNKNGKVHRQNVPVKESGPEQERRED